MKTSDNKFLEWLFDTTEEALLTKLESCRDSFKSQGIEGMEENLDRAFWIAVNRIAVKYRNKLMKT